MGRRVRVQPLPGNQQLRREATSFYPEDSRLAPGGPWGRRAGSGPSRAAGEVLSGCKEIRARPPTTMSQALGGSLTQPRVALGSCKLPAGTIR